MRKFSSAVMASALAIGGLTLVGCANQDRTNPNDNGSMQNDNGQNNPNTDKTQGNDASQMPDKQ